MAMTQSEKGKAALAQQQAQEQKRQQLLEEAESEEKERLRRIKAREDLAFLGYLKMRIEEEQSKQASERFVTELQKDFYRFQTHQAFLLNKQLLEKLAHHDELVRNFLFGEETEEEKETRRTLTEKAGFDEEDYTALVMADLSGDPKNVADLEKVFSAEPPSSSLKAKRSNSLHHTNEALSGFSTGKIDRMERILKEGIRGACYSFIHATDPVLAIQWSRQINGILSVISSHPVFFRDGASSPLLEAAAGMAGMGRVMENGLKALDELLVAKMSGISLPEEKEMNLQAEILLMQHIDTQRTNEQYQKFFSAGYHPKTGLQQENLKNLLNFINTSEAQFALSSMDSSQRLFTLSDPESRRSISEQLLVPRAEKAAEKQLEKAAPQRHR